MKPSPARPRPKMAKVAGSETGVPPKLGSVDSPVVVGAIVSVVTE